MGKWEIANNGSGKRIYFLFKDTPTGTEYHWSAGGNLVRYASHITAQKAADKLNA
jgi:hypothetical protein